MNESLDDNIVNYMLHKEYPSECKKVDKYVLRRTANKYSVEITPANKDDSSAGEGRPMLWFVGKGKKLLVIKSKQEKERVFLECYASNYGGLVARDNAIKKIRERCCWPEYYKDTISMVIKLEHFYCSSYTLHIYSCTFIQFFLNLF